MDFKRIILYVIIFALGIQLYSLWLKENPPATKKTTHVVKTAQIDSTEIKQALPVNTHTGAKDAHGTVAPDKQIQVHTDVLNVSIDEATGRLLETSLPKYPLSVKNKNTPYVLLNQSPKTYYTAISDVTGLNAIEFKSQKSQYTLQPGEKTLTVNLYGEKNGLSVTKQFIFTKGSYAINTSYTIVNHGRQPWEGRYFMQTIRKAPKDSTHLIGPRKFLGVATSSKKEPFDKHTFKDLKETPISESIEGGWLAFVQHYFLTAWIPNKQQPYFYQSQSLNGDLYSVTLMGPSISAAHGETLEMRSNFYVGPELKNQLDALSPHLALTIDYGFFAVISVPLFAIMKYIHAVVGNWGVAIILLTVLIKLIFYKLSEKSFRSMAMMRDLQPKIQALKEQYKDDRQALGRATMELYRKEGVNPMGGCLPMVVQIPVFIALYYVLAESVQLRMADFLWIHDLSMKDPYYILPILMGVSMFVQQRLSPPAADPMQAKMMMFMPVFFTIIFLNFPAGLTLYWLTNNTITVLQQWYILQKHKKGHYQKKAKKKRKK
ncbi:MAG: membrane protein insertase YidC [Gammaproteobacteria bacterium CG11_big_fil_rev_8_21_14_0_20_46_22]|nr:MAG: membrane protein insertase YidC [Gammaproteobacteria bacterium CG12_big_fil_rev_8_21_14_0_65_46_12]PIR10991.1 MAG: membrane protein insertase YidC [Gammaproteobacteria bacterium CG11_big_fil_rev_8_21_14_0_20_46_22]